MSESNQAPLPADYDDVIDLRVLVSVLWAGKWPIAALTVLFAVTSVAFALWLPDQYKAEVTLVPTSVSSTSSLGRLASQFGGLASIAGINFGNDSGEEKTVIAMELLKDWGFLDKFIRENHLEVEVFAARGWDRANNKLIIDDDLYDASTMKWVRDFDPAKGKTAEPSSWELYKELRERIEVSQDQSTNLVKLSVEYYSPVLAKEWIEKLVSAMNTHIRVRDRDAASKSIEYLEKQISETGLAGMKAVFYQLVEEQTKNLMLTEVSEDYVFGALSPPAVPEEKSRPNRALICVGGTFLGFLLGVILVLLQNVLLGNPNKAPIYEKGTN